MTNANVWVGVCDFRCEGAVQGTGRARVSRSSTGECRDSPPAPLSPRLSTHLRGSAGTPPVVTTCSLHHVSVATSLAHEGTHDGMKTADTVSVLQQAPGTMTTRAPDEVQWACGGPTRDLLQQRMAVVTTAARATSGT